MSTLLSVGAITFLVGVVVGMIAERWRYARSRYAKRETDFDKRFNEAQARIDRAREAMDKRVPW